VFEGRALKAEVPRAARRPFCRRRRFLPAYVDAANQGLPKHRNVRRISLVWHFFSPVDRMPLVEVIRGPKLRAKTIGARDGFREAHPQEPIVVNDGRAFYTSRVFGTSSTRGWAPE